MASDGMIRRRTDPQTGRQAGFIDITAGAILDDRVWCPRCLTSAAVTVEILALTGAGFKVLTTPTWCTRCHVFLTKRRFPK